MLKKTRVLSMESSVVEKQKETELVVYAKLDNFDYFDDPEHRNYRHIVQPQASLGSNQNCRCRKELTYVSGQPTSDAPDYSFTVKANGRKSKTLSVKTEYNFTVDRNFFDYFLETAESRQIKKRYTFQIENFQVSATIDGVPNTVVNVPYIKYEIDIFEKENGYRSPWVKIDIELDEAFSYLERKYESIEDINLIVSFKDLPFHLSDGFIEKYATPDQKAKLEELWKFEFKDFLQKKTI